MKILLSFKGKNIPKYLFEKEKTGCNFYVYEINENEHHPLMNTSQKIIRIMRLETVRMFQRINYSKAFSLRLVSHELLITKTVISLREKRCNFNFVHLNLKVLFIWNC